MGITKPRPLKKEDCRSDFDCGRESLNKWFHQHAWRNQASDASRTNIVCDAQTGKIVGYIALSSTNIERSFLAKKHQRNMPSPVPTILLAQLAVDKDYQGNGIANSLMYFALRTVLQVSTQIGCAVLLTHLLDDDVREFYKRYGFIDTPCDPDKSMCIRIADLKASMRVESIDS